MWVDISAASVMSFQVLKNGLGFYGGYDNNLYLYFCFLDKNLVRFLSLSGVVNLQKYFTGGVSSHGRVSTTHTARKWIKFMWVFKVFNIPQFVRHRSTNGNNFIIVLASLFQILQTVPQNQNCFKNWNSRRHKTCSFTSEQSLMPLLFVQVKRNVCFTVKEYMHCSFVTD